MIISPVIVFPGKDTFFLAGFFVLSCNSSPPPLTPPTRGGEYSLSLCIPPPVPLTEGGKGGGLGGGELLRNSLFNIRYSFFNGKLFILPYNEINFSATIN